MLCLHAVLISGTVATSYVGRPANAYQGSCVRCLKLLESPADSEKESCVAILSLLLRDQSRSRCQGKARKNEYFDSKFGHCSFHIFPGFPGLTENESLR